jgi:hypothetical protein
MLGLDLAATILRLIGCRLRSSIKSAERPERVAGCEDCLASSTSWLPFGTDALSTTA